MQSGLRIQKVLMVPGITPLIRQPHIVVSVKFEGRELSGEEINKLGQEFSALLPSYSTQQDLSDNSLINQLLSFISSLFRANNYPDFFSPIVNRLQDGSYLMYLPSFMGTLPALRLNPLLCN